MSDDVYYYNPQKVPPVVNHGTPEFPEYAATRYYSSDFTEKRMVSYFGRLGYNYKQRYLLEFTFRRDGSSTFGETVGRISVGGCRLVVFGGTIHQTLDRKLAELG